MCFGNEILDGLCIFCRSCCKFLRNACVCSSTRDFTLRFRSIFLFIRFVCATKLPFEERRRCADRKSNVLRVKQTEFKMQLTYNTRFRAKK